MRKIALHGKYGEGKFALVDNDIHDFLEQFSWWCDSYGYAITGSKLLDVPLGTRMHRLIMKAPRAAHIDHINGNPVDNRKSNLRLVTHQQNAWNAKPTRNRQYKNIINKGKGKWYATIHQNNQVMKEGPFKNADEAARAYNELAVKYRGEYARLNEV
jgi:hypothetical protein